MKIFNKKVCLTMALFPMVFLAIGILMFWIGVNERKEYKRSVEVSATVVECEYDTWYDVDMEKQRYGYDIYVDYTFEGEKYSHVYYNNQSYSTDIGEVLTVRVHPDNPGNIISASPNTYIYIGIPFAIGGIICLFAMLPMAISDDEFFIGSTEETTSKIRYLFLLIPLVGAVVFGMLGTKNSPLFHIGTIIFTYFVAVVFELLHEREL